MKRSLQDLLKHIKDRRSALLKDDYDEHQLHQLRVNVRRLRGLLRFEDSHEAWQLRREWGYLISHTNSMRDWDTLAARVDELPENEQPVGLVDTLTATRQRIWRKIRKSLKSDDWKDTARRTRAYLKHRVADEHPPPDANAIIREASARLSEAWARAQEQDNNRAWHKLRIAVKDLRYSLDMLGEDASDQRIDLCKELQAQLGTWHDSIIHRDLLDEIDRELGKDELAAKQSIERLQNQLKLDGAQCLKEARHILTNRGSLLLQGSSSSGNTLQGSADRCGDRD